MSATFCAFNFSPAALALPQAEVVVATMANLFRCGWWVYWWVQGARQVGSWGGAQFVVLRGEQNDE
jgi:hypothetical protein